MFGDMLIQHNLAEKMVPPQKWSPLPTWNPWFFSGFHAHEGSMGLVYLSTFSWFFMVNVAKYSIHGSYWIFNFGYFMELSSTCIDYQTFRKQQPPVGIQRRSLDFQIGIGLDFGNSNTCLSGTSLRATISKYIPSWLRGSCQSTEHSTSDKLRPPSSVRRRRSMPWWKQEMFQLVREYSVLLQTSSSSPRNSWRSARWYRGTTLRSPAQLGVQRLDLNSWTASIFVIFVSYLRRPPVRSWNFTSWLEQLDPNIQQASNE